MSTGLVTEEDYRFFDYLAPYRWPTKTAEEIAHYRELVATGEIQIETLLENALVTASQGRYSRVCEDSHDHSDGSDAKKSVSQHRCNDYGRNTWTNSWRISNVKNKRGLLRCLCYSRQTGQFHHFAIPYKAYADLSVVEIMLDQSMGYREPRGIPKGKWCAYEVKDFETLARVRHQDQARIRL